MFEQIEYESLPSLSGESYTYMGREGELFDEEEDILQEHLMEVYINDLLTMKLICLPSHLEELALGRLLTEGIIHSLSDIEMIQINKKGSLAKIYLTEQATKARAHNKPDTAFVETTPTSCTSNHILNQLFIDSKKLKAVTPIPWKKEWIFHLADAFAKGTPLHEKTWATHSCFLAIQDEILFSCEDIGRHNALDKAIGYALLHGIDLKKCLLYSSGRVPTDMVLKVIRAGIPVFSSKASPTKQAVDLAKEYHLTLVCQARRDRMKQYA